MVIFCLLSFALFYSGVVAEPCGMCPFFQFLSAWPQKDSAKQNSIFSAFDIEKMRGKKKKSKGKRRKINEWAYECHIWNYNNRNIGTLSHKCDKLPATTFFRFL